MNPTCIPADTNGSTKFAATLSGANTEYAGVDFDSGYSGSSGGSSGGSRRMKTEGGVRRRKKEEEGRGRRSKEEEGREH